MKTGYVYKLLWRRDASPAKKVGNFLEEPDDCSTPVCYRRTNRNSRRTGLTKL
jgi:hypothetical protein